MNLFDFPNLKVAFGMLLALVILCSMVGPAAQSGEWWDGFRTGEQGMNGTVEALTVYKEHLVAAGRFTKAGDTDVDRIALWNGSTWEAMYSPFYKLDPEEYPHFTGMEVINDKLYVMGGGSEKGFIAIWNGESWENPHTFNGTVYALKEFGGDLIAGGYFTEAAAPYKPPVNGLGNVARWNGDNWEKMGPQGGMDGSVNALVVYNDTLVAGGHFWEADGYTAFRLARWDEINDTWTHFATESGIQDPS